MLLRTHDLATCVNALRTQLQRAQALRLARRGEEAERMLGEADLEALDHGLSTLQRTAQDDVASLGCTPGEATRAGARRP